jgi:signal peptidase I
MKGIIKDVGVAVIIVAMTLQFYEPTRVFGNSMEPNFEEKDYLILSREAFDKKPPEYGDVVVFQSTLKDSKGRVLSTVNK